MGSLMNYENENIMYRRVRRSDTPVLHLNADRNVILKNEWKNEGINPMDVNIYNDILPSKLVKDVYEWAKKSRFRKWQEGLTGWKFWVWQIVGGITFVIIMEFILNKIGMTMLPWR